MPGSVLLRGVTSRMPAGAAGAVWVCAVVWPVPAGFMKASREMSQQGTFTELGNGFPGGELNKMLGD